MSLPAALTFDSPALLWTLLIVPVAALGYVLAQRRRARYAVRFTNLDLLATLVPRTPAWQRVLPAALTLLALASLLVSLARPHALIPISKEQALSVPLRERSDRRKVTLRWPGSRHLIYVRSSIP